MIHTCGTRTCLDRPQTKRKLNQWKEVCATFRHSSGTWGGKRCFIFHEVNQNPGLCLCGQTRWYIDSVITRVFVQFFMWKQHKRSTPEKLFKSNSQWPVQTLVQNKILTFYLRKILKIILQKEKSFSFLREFKPQEYFETVILYFLPKKTNKQNKNKNKNKKKKNFFFFKSRRYQSAGHCTISKFPFFAKKKIIYIKL